MIIDKTHRDKLLSAAIEIGEDILSKAEKEEIGISWKTLSMDSNQNSSWNKSEGIYGGVSGIALLIVALYISRRFKTWRPINLGLLAFISLNIVVGGFKYALGRTKPRIGIDLLHAGGMSYPSGHASNAIFIWGVIAYLIYRYAHVNRYRGRLASAGVGLLATTVCTVSLIRNTHWFSDLFGGLLLGGALLVLIIAIDRYFPSDSQLH